MEGAGLTIALHKGQNSVLVSSAALNLKAVLRPM